MDTYCALLEIPDDPMMPPVMIADRRGMPKHPTEHGFIPYRNLPAPLERPDYALDVTKPGVVSIIDPRSDVALSSFIVGGNDATREWMRAAARYRLVMVIAVDAPMALLSTADEHEYLVEADALVALMDLAVRATMDGVAMVAL